MKLIAYIYLRHYLFSQMIPKMQDDDFDIFPFNCQENLLKLKIENIQEEYAMLWDYILSSEKYDMVWSYHRPDEIALKKFDEYKIPVFIQEFFGWHPFRLPSVFPFAFDYEKFYASGLISTEKRPKETPVIVLPLERILFSEENTISNTIKRHMQDEKSPFILTPYWYTNNFISSSINFLKLFIDIISSDPDFKSCKFLVRPDPKYAHLQIKEIEVIKKSKIPNLSLDFEPIQQSLNNSDIVVCVNTNYGIDALRNGSEVITYGGRTFFSNPQLAESPSNPLELYSVLKDKINLIRERGKRGKPFMPRLVDSLSGPLACNCEAPYDAIKMRNSLKYAFTMPRTES